MAATRPPKKGETLEVRLPHAAKAAFMARCHGQGRTASETVRRLIEAELAQAPSPPPGSTPRGGGWRLLAAALAGLVAGGVAAPSLAHSQAACRPGAMVAPLR